MDDIKRSTADKVCIVRAYLGRRRFRRSDYSTRARPSRFQAVSLRNFPLYIDQMEENLNISPEHLEHYSKVMARTLAIMHWLAEVDANDVEFVLAPPRRMGPGSATISNILGQHAVWMLDFDCCRR